MKQLSLRGEWGPDEFCPFGAYATAIELKVDLILTINSDYRGDADDGFSSSGL